MERLTSKEIQKYIKEIKEKGLYEKYQAMILDDFEEHHVVYLLEEDEIIALAYKNQVIPYSMKEYYNWYEMNLLIEERSEEHTSELQSRQYLVCRLLLEKKK